MSLIPGLLAFLGAIFVIVLIHEMGHLVAAKRAGMEASVFSVGFGPRLWGRTWRGTEYRLSLVPLGGYVRIDAMEETVEGRHGATTRFDTYPWRARFRVVAAGIAMNLFLAALLYMAIPMVWGIPVEEPLRLASVDAATLPETAAGWADVPADARVLGLGDRRVADARELYMAVVGAPAGPAELVLGDRRQPVVIPEGDDAKLALVSSLRPGTAPVVGALEGDGAARRAGLRSGDRLLALDGVPVATWYGWRLALARAGEGTLDVRVRRGDREMSVALPHAAGAGPVALGMARGEPRVRPGPTEALHHAGRSFVDTVDLIRESWTILVTGRLSARQVSGPVTIVDASVRIFRSGWEPFLSFVAFLSVNIALVNALPVPALDGGYLALLGLELVRRRPVPQPVQAYLGRVGVIWLALVMAGTLVNDVLRLTGR